MYNQDSKQQPTQQLYRILSILTSLITLPPCSASRLFPLSTPHPPPTRGVITRQKAYQQKQGSLLKHISSSALP